MNINLIKLTDILSDLKNASKSITVDNAKITMSKYDILFLGAKFNSIYSVELYHSLNNVFNFNITMDELHSIITTACNSLNMKFEELINVEDIGKSVPTSCYKITLW